MVEPSTIEEALVDEHWVTTMHNELNQFKRNEVQELVSRPSKRNITGTKLVLKNKLDEHGLITRNKERLVAKGYHQQEGIDIGETYAPVARILGRCWYFLFRTIKKLFIYTLKSQQK